MSVWHLKSFEEAKDKPDWFEQSSFFVLYSLYRCQRDEKFSLLAPLQENRQNKPLTQLAITHRQLGNGQSGNKSQLSMARRFKAVSRTFNLSLKIFK